MEPVSLLRRLAAMTPARTAARNARVALPLAILALVLVAAACGPTGSGNGPGGSAAPSHGPVGSPEAAVAAIRARVPWFDGIPAKDPGLLGQSASWEAERTEDGIRVTFEVGWGDCQAGCIDRHTWTWDVAKDGTVSWVAEDGSDVQPAQLAAMEAASTSTGVGGRVTGGPTCPVERPSDPACAPQLVAGAVLVVKGAGGAEVARFTTDESGFYRMALPPGSYTLEAGPVDGFMHAPTPQAVTVTQGLETPLDLSYDTGIR